MLVVGVALSARSWRSELQRHCRDHVADVAVTLLHDGRDAVEAGVDVVVVDDETSWLSAGFIAESRDVGVPVIALFDPDEADGYGRLHLERLGVECVAPSTVDPEDLVELVRSRRAHGANRRKVEAPSPLSARRPVGLRRIVAVGGPAGAGASEVAIGVAQTIADRSIRPILVDVDESHPCLARRLGLGLHPHLLTAVDAVRREHSLAESATTIEPRIGAAAVRACVARPAPTVGDRGRIPFDVIAGLVCRDDWRLARADDVRSVVLELAAQWPVVVARLGPSLEDLSRHVERYEISRTVVASADRVIGVCDGSATGVLRFLDWLVDVVGLVGDARLDVVVNRVPRWPGAARQLVDRLREVGGERLGTIVVLPTDRRVARAAWDGTVIASGPFLRGLRDLDLEQVVSGSRDRD